MRVPPVPFGFDDGSPDGGVARMPARRSVLTEVATVDPGDGLPFGRYAGGVLFGTVSLPPAMGRVAVGVVAVEVGVPGCHIDERRMARLECGEPDR